MAGKTVAGEAALRAAEANRKVFSAWASGTEAALKATFDMQNVTLNAGLSLMEATGSGSRGLVQQWVDAARKAQEAALEAFRENVRAAQSLADEATRSGGGGR
jgi:hypothetical protein